MINKTELIDRTAKNAGLTKVAAKAAVDALFEELSNALVEGHSVQITGFGKFEVRNRAERNGRNPQTGEVITIEAKRTVGFKPGNTIKSMLN